MISGYFLWFDNWTFKKWELQKHRIILSSYLLFTQMLGPFTFCHVLLRKLSFSARFLIMCKPRVQFYLIWWADLPRLNLYGSGPSHLLSWLEMVKVVWLGSRWSELFLQVKSFFQAAPLKGCPTYMASLLHRSSSLFSIFCLFLNAIMHKMLKSGFRSFKPIFVSHAFEVLSPYFSESSFFWLQQFFSSCGCKVDIFILNCFMTF